MKLKASNSQSTPSLGPSQYTFCEPLGSCVYSLLQKGQGVMHRSVTAMIASILTL